jgi:hypothetical protein
MEKLPNLDKFSHLKEGFKPLIVCLTNEVDIPVDSEGLKILQRGFSTERVDNINIDYSFRELDKIGAIAGGQHVYVISGVNEKDKYSDNFYSCTGLVVCGTDKETGENISILTHQFPGAILGDAHDDFWSKLEKQLHNFKIRCEGGSIDSILLGGDYLTNHHKNQYIEQISQIVKSKLGFSPNVVGGPKLKYFGKGDIIFVSTKNRIIFLARLKEIGFHPNYQPEEMGVEIENWDDKRFDIDINKE